jgi:hypothetical protein
MIIRTYPIAMKKLLQGAINLEGTDIKALLLNNTYTYDATDEFISDLAGEISGGGYARQTVTLTAGADTTNNFGYVTPSGNLQFNAVTGTVKHLVIAKDTGNNATSPVILAVEFITPYVLTSNIFRVIFTGNLLEIG